jgi:hypothetical protein
MYPLGTVGTAGTGAWVLGILYSRVLGAIGNTGNKFAPPLVSVPTFRGEVNGLGTLESAQMFTVPVVPAVPVGFRASRSFSSLSLTALPPHRW